MSKLVAWFGRSRKAIAAFVGAVLVWCQGIALQDGGFHHITAYEWVALATAVATALGVYSALNDAPAADVPTYAPTTSEPVDHA